MKSLITVLLFAAGTILTAQSPSLVVDLNRTPVVSSSNPDAIARIGKDVYLAAETQATGSEPHVLLRGVMPRLLRDITPGAGGSSPRLFTGVGTRVFFAANGRELWWTDRRTTRLIRRVGTGAPIRFITTVGTRAFFGGLQSFLGLWVSDGTTAGTTLLNGTVNPQASPVEFGGKLYFANQGRLWVSDGTVAGTKSILSATTGVSTVYRLGQKLLLDVRFTPQAGLWITDGTPTGTSRLTTLRGHGVVAGTRFYFLAVTSTGYEFWRTDGTAVTTKKIRPIPCGSAASLFAAGAKVFVFCWRSSGHDIWVSGGTAANTSFVASITSNNQLPQVGTFASGSIVFLASDSSGHELWVSNGTTVGTRLLADIWPGPFGSVPLGFANLDPSNILFAADDGRRGREVWVTNGTANGTRLLADIQKSSLQNRGVQAVRLVDHAGVGLFSVTDDRGRPLGSYLTDGTTAGTAKYAPDLIRHSALLGAQIIKGTDDVAQLDGHVYSGGGGTLFRTDGKTSSSVVSLPGGNWGPANLFAWNGHVYFTGPHPQFSFAHRFFRSDGSTSNLTPLYDTGTMLGSGTLRYVVVDNKLFFAKTGGEFALHVTGGKANNTQSLMSYGQIQSRGPRLGVLGDKLYFRGTDSGVDEELWRSDGTPAGTLRAIDINPGRNSSNVILAGTVGNKLFLIADDGKKGMELWTSDGTPNGTTIVKDIATGAPGIVNGNYDRANSIAVGDWLYFTADDGVHGEELWRSDGTAVGTTLVADLWKGATGSRPHRLTVSGGRLLFFADDGVHGNELFALDLPAHTLSIGSGCAAGGAPQIATTPPRLGSTLTINISGKRRSRGVLLLGARPRLPAYLGTGCTIYVDLSLPFQLIAFTQGSNGQWSLRTPIPNNPALHGLLLPLQAGLGPSGQPPLGVDLTAGLLLAIRR